MKYIKLVSDGTWFVKGSEVWHYDEFRRINEEEWKEWAEAEIVNCRGLRISEGTPELDVQGQEYIDGETCTIDEFSVEFVDTPEPFS